MRCSPELNYGHRAINDCNHMEDLRWSPAEKRIARQAFNLALGRELDAIMRETGAKAEKLRQPSDLWQLDNYFHERRKEIERK
jgi:hypothetical protein